MTAVAIDFGTSNTVVCVLDPATQTPRTLKFEQISRQFEVATRSVTVVPTLVFVPPAGGVVLGETVRSQRLGFAQPERYFQSFKRDLVADYQPPPRYLGDQVCTPEWISEQFLQEIWQQIQQQVQPTQVILTVPVGSFERYLDWFREVATRLNLPNLHLVDESTAAALGYAVKRPGSIALVIDFGGGTLDLSLVRTVANSSEKSVLKAEVLAKSDAYVGGVDIDTWLVEDYLRRSGSSRSEVGEMGWQNLLEIAEKLKIRLSNETEVKDSWFDDENFIAHELHITRSQFEQILESQQLLEQVRQALDEVLAIALGKGISKSEIELVLLVGGSCLIPAVQQLMLSYFGRQRVKLHKPFEAVAHGALCLSQLAGVEDYLHHSYAIRLWEPFSKTYSYYPLFERGSRYPCQQRHPLTLQVATEGQREIRLDIGEVAEVLQAEVTYDAQGRMTSSHLNKQENFRSLEADRQQVCVAHLNPAGQLGVDRISVQFEVNDQRVLVATVRDLLTDQVLVEQGAIAKLR
jgi:molecular chaperone DnaK (HSP70)